MPFLFCVLENDFSRNTACYITSFVLCVDIKLILSLHGQMPDIIFVLTVLYHRHFM